MSDQDKTYWFTSQKAVFVLSVLFSIFATWYAYINRVIVAYGDAESHLNIAKRVVDSITPGFAQLGGIWLPLPHILLLPFVKFDTLWRTGLAGSIVSGIAFVVSAIFIYKLILLLTKNSTASFLGALIFILNPNVLYLQSTPMTELVLVAFFTLSSYYFIKFIKNQQNLNYLILAAFFGFCASLSRYDGWFLVLVEAVVLILLFFPFQKFRFDYRRFQLMEGHALLFSTLALFGIALWLIWGYLILGDPLFFTHSQFSAKSQQSNWLMRGELPAYKDVWTAFVYYFYTSVVNVGGIIFAVALLGFVMYVFHKPSKEKIFISVILGATFWFYVTTLYMGQSVIFIRPITPESFEWTLFNVRYGIMMVPTAAVFFAYLFARSRLAMRTIMILFVVIQTSMFAIGHLPTISKDDGTIGLSGYREPDAQRWINNNYDGGLVLMDDYARTISVIRSGIPMQSMIYVGNKPYWEESLVEPEKYARWIIIHEGDSVWQSLIDNKNVEARLYKYFVKEYTSPNILIFRRNNLAVNASN